MKMRKNKEFMDVLPMHSTENESSLLVPTILPVCHFQFKSEYY